MERVAERENRDPEFVREQVANGQAVIPRNQHHEALDPMIIGREFATKVNANIGNSDTTSDLKGELQKFHTAVRYGADTVMDLSTGSDLDTIREANVEYSPVPIGTVPIYKAVKRVGSPKDITHELLLDIIEKQAEQGVDYMTIHADLDSTRTIKGPESGGAVREHSERTSAECPEARARRRCRKRGPGVVPDPAAGPHTDNRREEVTVTCESRRTK